MLNNEEQLLFIKDMLRGVISIGGSCPVSCVFCSRISMQEKGFVKPITLKELKTLLPLLNKLNSKNIIENDIWLGDGRILSDEPFVHPEFIEIFNYIKNRYSNAIIRMTTIGQYVKPEWYETLLDSNLSLLVSVNTFDEKMRKNVIRSKNLIANLKDTLYHLEPKISKISLMYYGDLDVLKNDLKILYSIHPNYRDKQIKLSVPDYGKYHSQDAKDLHNRAMKTWYEANEFMFNTHKNYVPIIRNLDQFPDNIGEFLNVWRRKFDKEFSNAILEISKEYDLKKVCFLLSESVYNYAKKYSEFVNIIKVPNITFGGSYCVSGLITKDDITEAIKDTSYNCYILSKNMFSEFNEDIKGNHILDFGIGNIKIL